MDSLSYRLQGTLTHNFLGFRKVGLYRKDHSIFAVIDHYHTLKVTLKYSQIVKLDVRLSAISNTVNLQRFLKFIRNQWQRYRGLKQCFADPKIDQKYYQFVCKTDVLYYYEIIDQHLLIEQIHQQIENKSLRHYIYQVAHRTVEYGDINHGISRRCPIILPSVHCI